MVLIIQFVSMEISVLCLNIPFVCVWAISLLKMETFGVTIAIQVFTSTDVALFPPDVC